MRGDAERVADMLEAAEKLEAQGAKETDDSRFQTGPWIRLWLGRRLAVNDQSGVVSSVVEPGPEFDEPVGVGVER